MDLSSALSVSWPVILVCVVAIAAVAWVMKTSAAALRQSLGQLAGTQAQLNSKLGDLDRQIGDVGAHQTELMNRLMKCEQALQRTANAPAPVAKASADDAETIEVPGESLQRFEAASQALAQLAQELGGFDARQTENWQRIKGDLEEQSFHLQRVQQHVDRLFTGTAPEQDQTPATAHAA